MHATPRRGAASLASAASASPSSPIPPNLRWSYLTLYSLYTSPRTRSQVHSCSSPRRHLSSSTRRHNGNSGNSTFNRSDFGSQPFTGIYEPGLPTAGPLGAAASHPSPRITPRMLKEHLDQFVVGQERAKKVLSTAVYNHYQRVEEVKRQDEEVRELVAQWERRNLSSNHGTAFERRHPVEGMGRDSPSRASSLASAGPSHSAASSASYERSAGASSSSPSSLSRGEVISERSSPLSTSEHEYERVLTLESDEFPGQPSTTTTHHHQTHHSHPHQSPPIQPPPPPLADYTPLTIEKSNVLLLGPSGVGKTLMAKTLARTLSVPFSMSDCTPLTQAGYIGEDVEVIIQRLLAAANYDVAAAECGIVCLDEIDKIATARVSHGKDVSGEGVQQALLKIVEGTTVQVSAKVERSAPGSSSSHSHSSMSSRHPPPGWTPQSGSGGSHLGGGTTSGHSGGGGGGGQGGKGEVYNVRTDNILFICTGAFVGLHKIILDRISRGSIGFGATVRTPHESSSASGKHTNDTNLKSSKTNDELFKKHLPFFTPTPTPGDENTEQGFEYNMLDLVEPADLQKYGMIPELVGRIPISCALSSLSEEALVRVLTEPRNALLKQYEQLFSLSGIELRFTSSALRVVAKDAAGMGTGARGLKTVLERLLGEAMFEAPGSATKHVLITEAVAMRKEGPVYFARGQQGAFHSLIAQEEEEWEARRDPGKRKEGGDGASDFREFREKAIASGSY